MDRYNKAMAMFNIANNIAQKLTEINGIKIPFIEYTQKRIFPNRDIPKRVKRLRRKEAKELSEYRSVQAALIMAMAAMQSTTLMSNTIPKYERGTKN